MIKLENKIYRVYGMPIEAKSYDMNDDGTLTITGIASTTNKDYANEIVSPEVIKSLAEQAVGLNLMLDHNRHYDGGIGAIVNAWVKDDNLWVEAKILSEFAPGIKERLDIGMNFGFSISGFPRKQRTPEGILIVDYDLKEITLTYMPMNWDTFGTIEYKDQNLVASNCLTGACNHMLKSTTDGETMEKNDKKIEEEPVEPVDKKDNAGLTDEQLSQVKDVINEVVAELEPRIVDNLRPELESIADTAASKSAQEVADRVIAELKATTEVQETEEKELPEDDETVDDDETVESEVVEAEEEEVKSEAGMAEPETGDLEEDKKDVDSKLPEDEETDEIEEKSISQMVHDEIVKQMNKKSMQSKFDKFRKESTKHAKKLEQKSMPKIRRDQYGRNLDYV